jgi:hypothetical protein
MTVVSLLICLLGLAGAGCRNLYRETQSLYPPNCCDRLKLRIAEARQAEKQTVQAQSRLHTQLANGRGEPEVQADVDRFATAALDFRRRVDSARDVAMDCECSAEAQAELERLQQRATELLQTVCLLRQKTDIPDQ